MINIFKRVAKLEEDNKILKDHLVVQMKINEEIVKVVNKILVILETHNEPRRLD